MRLHLLIPTLVVLVGVGCREAVLNAPPTATLSISATPTAIPVNGGEAAIRAIVRLASGDSVPDGVIVNFFTTLGSIGADARTVGGVATVKLVSTGTTGVAVVSALSGAAPVATIDVTIGIAVAQVTVGFQPPALPAGGGSATVTARALDGNGDAVAGRVVKLTATAPGVLASAGAPLITGADGRVTDTITTTALTTVTAKVDGSSISGSGSLGISTSPAAFVALTANPTALPAAGGNAQVTAFVTDAQASPLAGQAVTFSAGTATVSPTTVITDANGLARTTVTTSASVTVRGAVGGVAGAVILTVSGTGSTPLRIQLTASRVSVTDRTLPDLGACDPSGLNSQLPLTVEAKVTNLAGDFVDGVVVTLTIADLASDLNDGHGGFCTSTTAMTALCCGIPGCPLAVPAPTPTPSPTPCCMGLSEVCCNLNSLAKSAVATSGGAGPGLARFSFSFEDVDFCKCDFDKARCTARLTATAPDAAAANVLVISLGP